MFTVDDMMTRSPRTLMPHHTLNDAKQMMDSHRFRHIPIVNDDKQLLGLVTQRDVLAAQASSLSKQTDDYDEMQVKLSHFTQKPLFTVSPQAGLKSAALHMQQQKIGCLPVVVDDKLVGIITDSDFVAIAITLLEIQEETEPMEKANEDDALERY